jgi:trehalose synthase
MKPILKEVTDLKKLNIRRYASIDPAIPGQLAKAAKKLAGQTILHVNSVKAGGGVAELLKSQIPLERSLGLNSRWYYISGPPTEFFEATKKLHNHLQGKPGTLALAERALYMQVNQSLSESLNLILTAAPDATVVIHDPQLLPIIHYLAPRPHKFYLRLHVDLQTPNQRTLSNLKKYILMYDAVILSSEIYKLSMPWLAEEKTRVILPAIDPFTDKNLPLSPRKARLILAQFGINPTKPILSQVSRFDPWKDPVGVIRAFYLAKNTVPNLQLVLAGLDLAADDPQSKKVFEQVKEIAGGDRSIFLFSNPRQIGRLPNEQFVRAVYAASDVVIQKSLREGFGLTMTEAMWKAKPLVAGVNTGALAQIKNGKNGFLVENETEAADAIVKLLNNDALRKRMGANAKLSVQKNFLMPRYIRQHLKLY